MIDPTVGDELAFSALDEVTRAMICRLYGGTPEQVEEAVRLWEEQAKRDGFEEGEASGYKQGWDEAKHLYLKEKL